MQVDRDDACRCPRRLRRGARDLPERAGERRARRPAAVDLRPQALGPVLPRANGAQLVPARVPLPGAVRARQRPAAPDVQRARAQVRVLRPGLLAAGLLPGRAIALTVSSTLVLSTTAVGRVWCGWLCPQTIFMEMLFRKIEYAIEGSAAATAPAQPRARGRPTGSCATGAEARHLLRAVVPHRQRLPGLHHRIGRALDDRHRPARPAPRRPDRHLHLQPRVLRRVRAVSRAGLRAGVPYGRIMSAFIDPHTITVTYDTMRGEPRGKLSRRGSPQAPPRGDCIDCHQCVTVCPTGIDIRNGVQLECVNCTACMDACDDVMRRVQKPEGLIRLTSHEAVETGQSALVHDPREGLRPGLARSRRGRDTLVASRPALRRARPAAARHALRDAPERRHHATSTTCRSSIGPRSRSPFADRRRVAGRGDGHAARPAGNGRRPRAGRRAAARRRAGRRARRQSSSVQLVVTSEGETVRN